MWKWKCVANPHPWGGVGHCARLVDVAARLAFISLVHFALALSLAPALSPRFGGGGAPQQNTKIRCSANPILGTGSHMMRAGRMYRESRPGIIPLATQVQRKLDLSHAHAINAHTPCGVAYLCSFIGRVKCGDPAGLRCRRARPSSVSSAWRGPPSART